MDKKMRKRLLGCVPTNWLDSLLTGDKAVIGLPPWNCPDVERLLRAVRARIEAVCDEYSENCENDR